VLIGFRVFVFRDRIEYVKVVIHSEVGILKYNPRHMELSCFVITLFP